MINTKFVWLSPRGWPGWGCRSRRCRLGRSPFWTSRGWWFIIRRICHGGISSSLTGLLIRMRTFWSLWIRARTRFLSTSATAALRLTFCCIFRWGCRGWRGFLSGEDERSPCGWGVLPRLSPLPISRPLGLVYASRLLFPPCCSSSSASGHCRLVLRWVRGYWKAGCCSSVLVLASWRCFDWTQSPYFGWYWCWWKVMYCVHCWCEHY